MSHGELENQGTGLRDVFDVLVKAPSERLLSLTIQLGDSPEEGIIKALCHIALQKQKQALKELQKLSGNPLANHLSEKCCTSGGKLEDFGAHCGRFQAQTGESLSLLARIFKVLSEQRLCEPFLRDLAYRRALSSDCLKTSDCGNLEYLEIREEAKLICGPQFVVEMFSFTDLKSELSTDPKKSLIKENTTLKASVSQDESSSVRCLPNPLQESPSEPSYPTHLEISVPPTASFQGDKGAPETSGKPKPNSLIPPVRECEAENGPGQSQSPVPEESSEYSLSGAGKDSKIDKTFQSMSSSSQSDITQNESPTQPNTLSTETNFTPLTAKTRFIPRVPVPQNTNHLEEEEEEIFYAFVILHAPEDAELAERLKEKFETVIGNEGATFSEDFAIPGKTTLSCVEDAINNSAFTFLLLSCNFNTQLLEMKTNIALINSINKRHKFNTVIPLLPANNCMPRRSIPIYLQTLVPLDERKSFDRKLQKSLSPAKIEKQRRIWIEEQKVKRLQEADRLRLCMEQKLLLGNSVSVEHEGVDGRALWPSQPNIHIENANYIMIGNDSTMTVDLGGNTNKDGSV